jgi:hypothetical protein
MVFKLTNKASSYLASDDFFSQKKEQLLVYFLLGFLVATSRYFARLPACMLVSGYLAFFQCQWIGRWSFAGHSQLAFGLE